MDELPPQKEKFWDSFRKFLKLEKDDNSNHQTLKEILESNIGEVIDKEKREQILDNIIDFRGTIAREIMVPRIDIITAEKDATVEELIDLIADQGHSRIPIYDNTVDNIVGVAYAKDLLLHLKNGDKKEKVIPLMRKPYFVPESKKIHSLLKEFQKNKVHIAIVVDEYGGTAGIVTLEDILEEIVGEIQDEYDSEQPLYEFLDDHRILVDARMNTEEANELLNLTLPTGESFETIGGLVFNQLGRVPISGEEINFSDTIIKVKNISGHRIEKLIITKLSEKEEVPPEAE